MKLSQFKFHLPDELIAERPATSRDECRMMVIDRKTGEISHHIFKEIINYFGDGDMMVFNNTKVFPALLYGNKEKTGARIEVFLLRELNAENKLWDVLVEPARKIRIGNKLYFGNDESMVAEVIDTPHREAARYVFSMTALTMNSSAHCTNSATLLSRHISNVPPMPPMPKPTSASSPKKKVRWYRQQQACISPANCSHDCRSRVSKKLLSPFTAASAPSAKSTWKTSPNTAWTPSR